MQSRPAVHAKQHSNFAAQLPFGCLVSVGPAAFKHVQGWGSKIAQGRLLAAAGHSKGPGWHVQGCKRAAAATGKLTLSGSHSLAHARTTKAAALHAHENVDHGSGASPQAGQSSKELRMRKAADAQGASAAQGAGACQVCSSQAARLAGRRRQGRAPASKAGTLQELCAQAVVFAPSGSSPGRSSAAQPRWVSGRLVCQQQQQQQQRAACVIACVRNDARYAANHGCYGDDEAEDGQGLQPDPAGRPALDPRLDYVHLWKTKPVRAT